MHKITERPILFSGPMVRAILDGRKTMTRRVCKLDGFDGDPVYETSDGILREAVSLCPYGTPGDRLWVRETWCPVDDREFGGAKWIDYRATPKFSSAHPAGWENAPDDPGALKWKPSIFMPRWASRITLEIVSVKVERLQEITEADAMAEGVERMHLDDLGQSFKSYRRGFQTLWDSINGKKYPWESNPFAWVVEFKRTEAL